MSEWQMCKQFEFTDILFERQPGIARVAINRPEAMNSKLEEVVGRWCNDILEKSPGALRALKKGLNAVSADIRELEVLMYDLLRRYYGSPEAAEWKKAFRDKRPPEWKQYRRQETFPGRYEG